MDTLYKRHIKPSTFLYSVNINQKSEKKLKFDNFCPYYHSKADETNKFGWVDQLFDDEIANPHFIE